MQQSVDILSPLAHIQEEASNFPKMKTSRNLKNLSKIFLLFSIVWSNLSGSNTAQETQNLEESSLENETGLEKSNRKTFKEDSDLKVVSIRIRYKFLKG